ncbi:MAG: Gfo/Idh/MocA family oxidoreductase [Planctomycetes bacterium]|nr:Gfo/Idh/MocA family oxidoreductase [Planctomycetota bacterium]
MLKYVHIGVGGFGQFWCKYFLPRLKDIGLAEAVAAVDVNPENLALAEEQLGLSPEQLYADAEEAIAACRPDFITIVVPPAFHEQMVDLALKYDCHILSEKPIADTMEACCRIYKKVQASGKKMAVTMSHRFDQDKQTLEREIHKEKYGRLNYIVSRFTHNCREFASWGEFRHKIPDPLLIEGTVHHFDILRSLSASNAQKVHTVSWNPPWGEYAGDSTALIIIEMENGTKCVYEGAKANASTMNGWCKEYFRAECEHGTLELDARKLSVLRSEAWAEKPQREDIPLLEQDAWANAWLAELFCKWLQGGEAPANTLEDNIQCAALLFAAVESAHNNEIVDVQEYLQKHMDALA